jgi:hypothetical protein
MATHSFEFMMGVACLAVGLLSRFLCWFLRTRRAEALKQADDGLAEDGLRGVTVLGTFRFGAALLLFIGAALVAVSFIAYAHF